MKIGDKYKIVDAESMGIREELNGQIATIMEVNEDLSHAFYTDVLHPVEGYEYCVTQYWVDLGYLEKVTGWEAGEFKTFHRLMYETLSKEHYADLCRLNLNECTKSTNNKLKDNYKGFEPADALMKVFSWEMASKAGSKVNWAGVWEQLSRGVYQK